MYPILGTLALAAAVATPIVDRHADVRATEAFRLLAASHAHATSAVSDLYQYASHSVSIEWTVGQQMLVTASRNLDELDSHFEAMTNGLSTSERSKVQRELTMATDLHGKIGQQLSALKAGFAAGRPNPAEVKLAASQLYGTLVTAGNLHQEIASRLGIAMPTGSADHTR